MKLSIILILLSINSYSLFASEIDQVKEELLEKAVEDKDPKEFIELLGSSNSSKTKGKLSEGFGHFLLGIATSSQNWSVSRRKIEYLCLPSIVEELINKGAVSSTRLEISNIKLEISPVEGAIQSLCPMSLTLLIKRLNGPELAKTAQSIKLINFESIKNDEILAPKLIKIVQILGKANKALCEGANVNCSAVAHLKNEIALLENRDQKEFEHQEYLKTKAGQQELLKQKICFHHQQYLEYLQKINEEKEKGKVSGYVNAKLLKEWGDKAFLEKKDFNKLLEKSKLSNSKDLCK